MTIFITLHLVFIVVIIITTRVSRQSSKEYVEKHFQKENSCERKTNFLVFVSISSKDTHSLARRIPSPPSFGPFCQFFYSCLQFMVILFQWWWHHWFDCSIGLRYTQTLKHFIKKPFSRSEQTRNTCYLAKQFCTFYIFPFFSSFAHRKFFGVIVTRIET